MHVTKYVRKMMHYIAYLAEINHPLKYGIAEIGCGRAYWD